MLNFQASLDPLSIDRLHAFEQADLLPGAVQAGMAYGGRIILNRIQQYASERFANPTGRLGNSFQVIPVSRYQITVGSDVPYAHRWDDPPFYGPDALGRTFPNARAYRYATDALIDSEPEIGERMAYTISAAFARAGGR